MSDSNDPVGYGDAQQKGGELYGSSSESFEDAIQQALSASPRQANFRRLTVQSLEVEEGGFAGGITYRVTLNPQPEPPG